MVVKRRKLIGWRAKTTIFNHSEEANRLRYIYLKKIKEAYEKLDFSDLFGDLDRYCSWGGSHGRKNVIESLKEHAAHMKETNYLHQCKLVQVGDAYSPLECNTEPDGSGQSMSIGLLYNEGEICLIDKTEHNILFFRMSISRRGKIEEYYATLPSGRFHVIE